MGVVDDALLAEAVAAGLREYDRKRPRTNVIRTGTVSSVDYPGKVIRVIIDNETAATPCQIGAPGLYPGARCWVQFLEGGGAFAFGPIGFSHPWFDFVPRVFGGSTEVSLAITRARYSLQETTVDAEMQITCSSAGGAGAISASLPVPARTTGNLLFVGWLRVYRPGTGLFHGGARAFAQDRIDALRDPSDQAMGVANPVLTLAVNDVVQYTVRYERAV